MIASDNSTVLSFLMKEGGTRSETLVDLTSRVLLSLQSLNCAHLCRHIPGRKNILADQLSRTYQVIKSEWTLNLEVWDWLWTVLPRPQIDVLRIM